MPIFFSAYLPALFLLRDPDYTMRHCKYTNTPHFVPSQAVWLCGTISRACSGVRFSSSAAFPSPRLAWNFASRVLPTIPNPRSKTEVGTEMMTQQRKETQLRRMANGSGCLIVHPCCFLPHTHCCHINFAMAAH